MKPTIDELLASVSAVRKQKESMRPLSGLGANMRLSQSAVNLDWPAIEAAMKRIKLADELCDIASEQARHHPRCHGGERCDCGMDELIQALAAYRAAAKE